MHADHYHRTGSRYWRMRVCGKSQGAHEEMWEYRRLCFGNSHPSTSVCLYFTRQNIYHRMQVLPW